MNLDYDVYKLPKKEGVYVVLHTHCHLNPLFYINKCRSNGAIANKPGHDFYNLRRKQFMSP